jgi:hypothetical protein
MIDETMFQVRGVLRRRDEAGFATGKVGNSAVCGS